MAYRGSDLSSEFKSFFNREKRKITEILMTKGCTNIKLNCGFYYFSGFYTAPDGQIWYIWSADYRNEYRLFYRTARNYTDYTGGQNNEIATKELEKLPPITH